MMKYASLIVFLLFVAVSQERNLEKQNSDSQKYLELKDYDHLSESLEDDMDDMDDIEDSKEELDNYSEEDDDEIKDGSFNESFYNLLVRLVSKDSVAEPTEPAVTVDNMGVTYVNYTSGNVSKVTNIGGTNGSLNDGSKFTSDNIPALRLAYKSLDSSVKVDTFRNFGVVVTGRSESGAIGDNETEANTGEINSTSETAVQDGEPSNSTLPGDKPQARFGCLVSTLCIYCQQYAILPDNTNVCCLFCSIYPTIIPNNQGGFICSCDYLG